MESEVSFLFSLEPPTESYPVSDPDHILQSRFFNTHVNVILQSMLRSSYWAITFSLCERTALLSNACYLTHAAHPPLFDSPN
jgi:hypothetical protein